MTTIRTEHGFAHLLGLAVVVVVLAIIGFAGYKVMQSQKSNDTASTTATTSAVQKKIDTQPTLKAVDQSLSEATTALNSGFSTTTLDSDIQALY